MNISSAKLIYFSPTQTTRKIIESIAEGVWLAAVEPIDLTPPEARTKTFMEMQDEMAIIGSPVYAGRLPHDMISRFRRIRGNGAPAVIVVAYGNRAYEDALRELHDLAMETGFKPVAAAAFIGEHSYSTGDAPIAVGRPDDEDLRKAKAFGSMVREKLGRIRTPDDASRLRVPGNFPYKERSGLSGIAPVTREDLCAKCGECIPSCPVGAIAMNEAVMTDRNACIRCCACVKTCSTGARVMEDPRIRQIAAQLSVKCSERRESELFL